jgi:hypothetical protein
LRKGCNIEREVEEEEREICIYEVSNEERERDVMEMQK